MYMSLFRDVGILTMYAFGQNKSNLLKGDIAAAKKCEKCSFPSNNLIGRSCKNNNLFFGSIYLHKCLRLLSSFCMYCVAKSQCASRNASGG